MFDLQINNQCKLNASFMRISDLKLHSVNCKLRNAIYEHLYKRKGRCRKTRKESCTNVLCFSSWKVFYYYYYYLWLTLYFVYFKRTLETHGSGKIFELINNEFSSLVILIWETSLFLNVSLSNFFKADLPWNGTYTSNNTKLSPPTVMVGGWDWWFKRAFSCSILLKSILLIC